MPSFSTIGLERGKAYTFLVRVSDGNSFSTDNVIVRMEAMDVFCIEEFIAKENDLPVAGVNVTIASTQEISDENGVYGQNLPAQSVIAITSN